MKLDAYEDIKTRENMLIQEKQQFREESESTLITIRDKDNELQKHQV